MIDIHSQFESYTPPVGARESIVRLLAGIPAGHLAGLEAVVLTNSAAIGKGKTRRVAGRKYARSQCLGFYHPSRRGNGPWIELVVDNIAHSAPDYLFRLNCLADLIYSSTVYHEVGHHLDVTIGSKTRTGELAADDWASTLSRSYFRSTYPIQGRVLRVVVRIMKKFFSLRAQSAAPN